MKIEFLAETASTNDYIKRYLEGGEDAVVCARRQSGGKGTKGRSFLSEEGGVYLSFLTFSRLDGKEAFRVMAHAAVAVCRTAEKFGVKASIKWPNDVNAGGKKLCGILIENGVRDGKIAWSIVGIGVNVQNDVRALPAAINLSEAAGRTIGTEEVRDALIEEYKRPSDFSDYLGRLALVGEEISVTEGGRERTAVFRRVLPDGRLEIEENGVVRALSSAEIGRLGGKR